MKKLVFVLSVFFSVALFAQEAESEIKEANSEESEESKTVPFTIVEKAPTHPECLDKKTFGERRKCMNFKLAKHIRQHFKPNKKMYKFKKYVKDEKTGKTKVIDSKLESGRYRIKVKFKIGTTGEIEDIEIVDAPTHKLALEAKRVVSLLPTMEPGMQKGKPVRVGYFLPINFRIN